ncbi:ATP-binding protein [Haloplanus natans]|uniref:ATP-binding protein n=1 Tax=Haloplanus natans TaxID=376171 RepID=UPI0006782185|nr:ATP-binding protein [Haloplanus natans]
MHLTDTDWWHDLMKGIYGPRQGGAQIIVDAEDAEKGYGKTGLAVSLARFLSERVFGYELTDDDLTLSGARYLERWREHPGKEQPSVIILDELAGAGAGNNRRAMSNQNVALGSVWQLMRKKRIVTIVTLPHWSKADLEMRREATFRLHCLREPIGYFRPYRIGASFDDGKVTTEGYDDVERIRFPNMDAHDDPLKRALDRKKDNLLDSQYLDADKLEGDETPVEEIDPDKLRKEAKKEKETEIAQSLRDMGFSGRDVADMLGRSHTWVYDNTSEPTASA